MYYSFYDKKILGWKYYQHQVAAMHQSLGLKLLPSLLTAVLVIIFVARVLAFIDARLEMNAIRESRTGYLQQLRDLVLIPTAHAAAPYDVNLDYSKEAVKLIQSAYDIDASTSEVFTFTVGFKNSGKKIWRDKGAEQMLIVSKSQNSNYEFPTIYGSLREEVKPGMIGYFTIFVTAPDVAGVTKDEFVLLRSGKVISGSEFPLTYTVTKKVAPVVAAPVPVVAACPAYKAATALSQDDCDPVGQAAPSAVTTEGPMIRIGIFNSADAQTFSADQVLTLKNAVGQTLASIPSGTAITLDYLESESAYSYTFNGNTKTSSSYLILSPADSSRPLTINSFENRPAWKPSLNDNTFLGSLELRYNSAKNRTWVINELPIETYLKGIAETSNTTVLEYQKTMAIAARTYATHHLKTATKHADEYYILDATYDQVYKGYGTQQRITNFVDSVNATKGQVVTYNGQIAITPYFSWSDGRTRSMKEVWNVDKPWLQSVPEPAGYDKTEMFGHGVGISARGAYILADEQDYSADQILKYYYLGIEVKGNYNNQFDG